MRHRCTVRATLRAASMAALLPHVMSAQTSHGQVEVGAARLRQRDIPATHAATAGITLRVDARRYAVAVGGGVTLADEGRSTSQGLLTASLFGRPVGRNRWEIGGAITGFAQGASPLTGGVYALARQHFATGRTAGGWAGVALGGVEESDYWSPTRTAEVGWWHVGREARLTAAGLLVDTRSEPYGDQGNLVTDPVTYMDGSLSLHLALRRVDLDARGGLRLISRGALTASGRGTRPFAGVDAAVWLTPRVALVAGVGRHLSDLTRGTPDTRYAALALRVTMRERESGRAPARPAPTGGIPRLALVTDSAGQSRLVVDAPSGALVELAASFTSWDPIPLVRRGDAWELDRFVPSGAHRVLIRVDGGPWVVPANLPAAADDFGGTVGILTVP